MPGLLDWLSDSVFGGGAQAAPIDPMMAMGGGAAPPDPGAPPLTINRSAPGAMAPPGPPNTVMPLPPPIDVPNKGAPDASMLPPAAAPTAGVGMMPPPPLPPGPGTADAVRSYQGAGGTFAPPNVPGGPTGDAQTFIGRALGMDPNTEKNLRGGLAAGFKAAGNSAGKSPFQALASGAGEAMEGSAKTSDKSYDQRLKSIQLAVQSQSADDKAAYNKHYGDYLGAKLKADTDRAAAKDTGGGKSGAWNKPESQRFIDAQNALAKAPEIRAAQKVLDGAVATGNKEKIAAAQEAIGNLTREKTDSYLRAVGLDPKKMAGMAANPPGTPANPHTVMSKEDFDVYVKPGQAYTNPKDGKVYIRKGAGDSAGTGQPAAAPAMPTPPVPPGPPPIPTDPNTDE